MSWLSEDPWSVVGTLLAVAAGLLIAVRITQQGRFLTYAGAAAGLALLIVLIEQVWVTDNERIAAVVAAVARGVEAGDADAVMAQMAPRARLLAFGGVYSQEIDADLVRNGLEQVDFDLIRVNHLQTNAGTQSRRGSAEFRVFASGIAQIGGGSQPFAEGSTTWSFGLREDGPGVWKVNEVRAVRLPRGASIPNMGRVGRR